MKILSKSQIYEGDALTAQKQGISSTDLMERAATQIFNWLHSRMQGAQVPIHVFCGIGNNGGDGLVLSRHLINHGYNVFTYVVNYSDKRSKDFLINYDRIKQTTKEWPLLLDKNSELPTIAPEDIIVDAVFGIGLNRKPDDWVAKLFQHFKASKAFTLSIDIPSGVFTDRIPESKNDVVWAHYTLSFQTPKLLFFLPQTARFVGQWELLDIGLDPEYMFTVETQAELISKPEVLPLYKPRDKFSHKGTYGHALIIGGSYGKIGAVTLAGRGAMSVGAGLVTIYLPKCGYGPVQAAFPEAMTITDAHKKQISYIEYQIKPTAIAIGMGMGTEAQTVQAFKDFLKGNANNSKLVIDADALNILSSQKKLINSLPEQTILTPHAKELERLIGSWNDDFDKLEKLKEFSTRHHVIIVSKGAYTTTVFKDKYYINASGNPGLATAGTGDVLSGLIAGLLAQGYPPLEAAIFGVYLHGRSADIAVEQLGYQSLMASHVVEFLAEAYLDLFAMPEAPNKPDDEAKDTAEQA